MGVWGHSPQPGVPPLHPVPICRVCYLNWYHNLSERFDKVTHSGSNLPLIPVDCLPNIPPLAKTFATSQIFCYRQTKVLIPVQLLPFLATTMFQDFLRRNKFLKEEIFAALRRRQKEGKGQRVDD
jgi:hypothetical protein